MRVEIIALHSAYSQGGAHLYNSCGQLNIGGPGTSSPATVSFSGKSRRRIPGITINIHGSTGLPDNGGKAYAVPGPAGVRRMRCGGSFSGDEAEQPCIVCM